jgi:lipoprotein signal peptidase
MEQIQENEREKKSSGWLLVIAIIIISILIYWVIREFDHQQDPQVKEGKIMQIMV